MARYSGITLVVKDKAGPALEAARRHGIETAMLESIHGDWTALSAGVGELEKIVEWYFEVPLWNSTPFPQGTLLLYTLHEVES